jgi:hypothetical protein
MSHRLAIIGPHRRRTGTGPFVAEFLRQAGCSVVGWDRADAHRWLAPGSPQPGVEAVAICSPAETHLDYLVAALAKRLHVFCEKPILWPADHSCAAFETLIARLARALDSALRDRLVVHENTQWVYTFKEFQRLAGDHCLGDIWRFRCELSPSSGTAPEMLMECSAHANSLLLQLGCSGVEDLRMSFERGDGGRGAVLDAGFRSRSASGARVEVEYHFAQQLSQPRAAAFEINDLRVERRVELSGYRVSLQFGSQEHAIRDPLQSSVEDFLAKTSGPNRRPDPSILANIRMSCSLLRACPSSPEAAHA